MSAHDPDRLLRQAVGNAEDAWKAATNAGEMLMSAGWTIFFRSAMIANGAARGRIHRREVQRMVEEKVEAAAECSAHAAAGLGEMQLHLVEAWLGQMQLGMDLARAALDGRPDSALRMHKQISGSALTAALVTPMAVGGMLTRSYARALQPYHRRTGANAGRLARHRLWR